MKFIIQLLAISLGAFVFELFLPWYSLALPAIVFGYLLRSNANFLAGFLGVGLLWLVKIIWIESHANADLIDRVAAIFSLDERIYLILLSITLGGLVGGFAAWTGSVLKPSRKKLYY
jgi:hypothetical protein